MSYRQPLKIWHLTFLLLKQFLKVLENKFVNDLFVVNSSDRNVISRAKKLKEWHKITPEK